MKKLLILLLLPFIGRSQVGITPGVLYVNSGTSFSPTQIDGLDLWLEAAHLALSDGDPISTWADQSTGANDATQSGSNRPIYKASQLDGKAVVRFDGANDYMNLTNNLSNTTDYTLFVVYKKRTTGVKMPTLGNTADAGMYAWYDYSDDNMYVFSHSEPYYTAAAGFTSYTLIVERWSSTTVTTFKNAASFSISAGSGTGGTSGYAQIGIRGASEYADGDIAEILYYSVALGTTDRQLVENYLHTKYPSLY
jgi:hypothetical protein